MAGFGVGNGRFRPLHRYWLKASYRLTNKNNYGTKQEHSTTMSNALHNMERLDRMLVSIEGPAWCRSAGARSPSRAARAKAAVRDCSGGRRRAHARCAAARGPATGMISEARREASRGNGRRGQGPKTAEGKARSSRNAVRHGLSQPAALDPAFADQIAALARAIAGPEAGRERFKMACRIACAQMDVARVRRARADLLSVQPLDGATLARAVALDRYEARALSRRKRAIWAFDATSALAAVGAERDCASPAALSNMALRRSDGSADGDVSRPRCGAPARRRCQAGLPRQADPYRQPDPYAETNKEWRRIARLFGHTRRSELEHLAKRTRGVPVAAIRRPNESEAAPPDVRDLGQTNPRPCRPADTVLAERTREARDQLRCPKGRRMRRLYGLTAITPV